MRIIKITRLLLFVLVAGFSGTSNAQLNLVPNFDFETFSLCPTAHSQASLATGWYAPTAGTSDYFNACSPATSPAHVPQNLAGFQYSYQNGSGYCGVLAAIYEGAFYSYREYIQAMLTSPLAANKKYFVSFYVSLGNLSGFATDDFGAHFSQNPVSNSNNWELSGYTPQVSNTKGQFLNDTMNWMKISGSFVAAGNEHYITIGNFKDNSNTDTLKLKPWNYNYPQYNSAYYYIDYVCVSTDSSFCNTTDVLLNSYTVMQNNGKFYYNDNKIVIIETGEYTLQVFDTYSKKIVDEKLVGYQSIDLSGFSSGFYIIILKQGQPTTYKKVLKY